MTETASSASFELPPALPGERLSLDGRAGPLACYVSGPRDGAPLLLVHSVNAAASAFEVKPVFDWAAKQGRRVYAPDLPGFGHSQRGPRDYTIRLYTDAVHDLLERIAAEHGPRSADLLALSLGSEFAARATSEAPHRVRTLTLVTPTGFSRNSAQLDAGTLASREIPGMRALFDNGLWGQPLFDLLVSRRSVRYFMRRTFGSQHGGAEPDAALVDYAWLSAHQPGARHAPYAFLSARLFSRDIRRIYETLALPVWVPHATRGDFRDFSAAAPFAARRNWRFMPLPTGAMPFWERPDLFLPAFADFIAH